MTADEAVAILIDGDKVSTRTIHGVYHIWLEGEWDRLDVLDFIYHADELKLTQNLAAVGIGHRLEAVANGKQVFFETKKGAVDGR